MNLSVIHQPNELGALCDFRPYSFYLGGHWSYHRPTNNPNYELGPLAGGAIHDHERESGAGLSLRS